MFDKYFCRKFKEKKITLAMLIDYLEDYLVANHFKLTWGIVLPIIIFMLYIICASLYYTYLDRGITAATTVIILAVPISVVVLRALHKIETRIVVATCPLNKK